MNLPILSRLCMLGLVVWAGFAASSIFARQPNILLIMADDLRQLGGAFTADQVKTPNLDRLRARGTTFERAYVQYPVCNPSRSSLLSGLRPETTRIVDNQTRLRERLPEVVTFPELLKNQGWHTAAFGKIFHLGGGRDPQARARWTDDGRSWHQSQAFSATPRGQRLLEGRNVTGGSLTWCAWGAADGGDADQPDGQIAAATIETIERLGDQPWLIGCGFQKPHDPFIAPKQYFDWYPLESLNIWEDPAATEPAPSAAVGFGNFGQAFHRFSPREWQELMRAYCACTSFMDAQLGKVLDALDRAQLWEKTLVIFVGDHGYHTGERQWWNKNTLFERSCRTPLIIAAPGTRGGQSSRSLVEFVDLYPTILDFCGLSDPHPQAGASVRPILNDPTHATKDAAFTLVTRGPGLFGQSVRVDRWRLTRWSDGSLELYDHTIDPEELDNVVESNPAVVVELTAKLQTLPAYP
jgi:iduronate 2-sulfatase